MPICNTALVIADISGYTAFIRFNQATLDHAAGIIGELLEVVADGASHPLRLNKLEGDAAFLCAELTGDEAQGMRDIARQAWGLFHPFREKVLAVAENRSFCPCAACQSVRGLRLKVVLHKGLVDIRRIRGFEELTGEPVIATHRLLKNGIVDREYLAITGDAHALCGDIAAARVESRLEHYDDLGTIGLRVFYPAVTGTGAATPA